RIHRYPSYLDLQSFPTRRSSDLGNIVLRDRRILSEDGIFIAVVTIDRENRQIKAGPEIQSRGFVYVKESEELLSTAEAIVKEVVEDSISTGNMDWNDLKQNVRESLGKYLYESTKRRPMIIPIISEI